MALWRINRATLYCTIDQHPQHCRSGIIFPTSGKWYFVYCTHWDFRCWVYIQIGQALLPPLKLRQKGLVPAGRHSRPADRQPRKTVSISALHWGYSVRFCRCWQNRQRWSCREYIFPTFKISKTGLTATCTSFCQFRHCSWRLYPSSSLRSVSVHPPLFLRSEAEK